MSTIRASLLAAVCLITIAPATAFTIPSTFLRLLNRPSRSILVAEEPERPQWPAQYQVRLLHAAHSVNQSGVYLELTTGHNMM